MACWTQRKRRIKTKRLHTDPQKLDDRRTDVVPYEDEQFWKWSAWEESWGNIRDSSNKLRQWWESWGVPERYHIQEQGWSCCRWNWGQSTCRVRTRRSSCRRVTSSRLHEGCKPRVVRDQRASGPFIVGSISGYWGLRSNWRTIIRSHFTNLIRIEAPWGDKANNLRARSGGDQDWEEAQEQEERERDCGSTLDGIQAKG